MGLLDVLAQIAQQGNQSQQTGQAPALGDLLKELLQGKAPADGSAPPAAPQPPGATASEVDPGASLNEGLAELIAKLEAGGLGEQIKSWIGSGQNAPVEPGDLGSALGQNTVARMAEKAGVGHDDLLSQLAKALPGIIDSLTADPRAPSQAANDTTRSV